MDFEWDERKDRENLKKHGVSFYLAQFAFADPRRVIAEDVEHGGNEERYYCFGQVGEGIVTVRLRFGRRRSVSLARDFGERAKGSMSKRITYTNEPVGKVKVIKDFL